MKRKWTAVEISALTDRLQSPLRGEVFIADYRKASGDTHHSVGAIHSRVLSLGQAFNVDVKGICASLRDEKAEKNMSEKVEAAASNNTPDYVPAKYVADRFGIDPRAVSGNLRALGIEAVRQEISGRSFILYRKSEIDALPASWEEVGAMARKSLPTLVAPSPSTVRTRVDPAAILAAWKAGVISEEEMIQKIKALT